MKSIQPNMWLKSRNMCLVNFLQGVTGVDYPDRTAKKENAFCHLIEQVLYTRNLNIVIPFAFKRNLITYCVTNSKTAVQLQGAWESSGSYTTLHGIVTAKTNPVECPLGECKTQLITNKKLGFALGKFERDQPFH